KSKPQLITTVIGISINPTKCLLQLLFNKKYESCPHYGSIE
ncbi:MAG: hypothetical protein ACI8ZX_002346, partial [Planctomycetota bacterium]